MPRHWQGSHLLVVLYKELAGLELGGVHDVQQLPACKVILLQILAVELASHRAPHLCTLHVSDMPRLGEIQPVGLVQLGPCR